MRVAGSRLAAHHPLRCTGQGWLCYRDDYLVRRR